MAEQFKEQGGVATMDPTRMMRWLTSRLMTKISSPRAVAARHRKAEQARLKTGAPHRVDYFHQVEEGYSALTAQLLHRLVERYDIALHCHLVRGQEGKNAPEPELLARLARCDSALIAPGYGLDFPADVKEPTAELIAAANEILAAQSQEDFPQVALTVSDALWRADLATMSELADRLGREVGAADGRVVRRAAREVAQAVRRRRRLPVEDVQRAREPLEAEDVVPVGRHLHLVHDLGARRLAARPRLRRLHLLLLHVVELDPELEAQLVELLLGVGLAERGEELIAVQVDGRLGREGKGGWVRQTLESRGRAGRSAGASGRAKRMRSRPRRRDGVVRGEREWERR